MLGFVSEDWWEVCSGLEFETEVIVDGHQVLEPGDRIAIHRRSRGEAATDAATAAATLEGALP